MGTVAEALSGFAYSLRFEDLPQIVIHEAKRRIIDSLGCALGAVEERPVKIARSLALEVSCSRGATVLGTGHKSSPDLATFVNGIMIRYFDYNDSYASLTPSHPSDNLSAALALTEAEGAGGRELITALVLGYEVQCRLCDAASLKVRGWDHVTYGTLSTALVSGKLLRLTEEQMVHALGLAAVPNITLRLTRFGELSMWKGCASANAARNGVFAALLAKRGMTGPAPLFEGEKGFFDQVTGPFRLDPLGSPFKILESSIKFYPVEFLGQTAIEAALGLREQISSIDEVAGVDIDTFDACVKGIAGGPEKWRPATRETADHSLPYCVAVALADGAVTPQSFSTERISDPKLYELMQKIRVHSNDDFTAQYPKVMPNEVRVQLGSGKVIQARVSYAHGHPKNPLTDAEVETKFRGLASAFLPEERMNDILAHVWDLEKVQTLEPLFRMLNLDADKA